MRGTKYQLGNVDFEIYEYYVELEFLIRPSKIPNLISPGKVRRIFPIFLAPVRGSKGLSATVY